MTAKISIIRLVFICSLKLGFIYSQFSCKGFPNGCCPGYQWNNNTEKCTACEAGFSGISCTYKCVYPSYGLKCKQVCACSNDRCDFILGCQGISTLVQKSKYN
ncbi:scavenger receptor class F member 2-like [Saccostrea cucullata]|uniref:scavenger receptor class F member 2-like n=1 Tax=Saccostrea cuccullata TaxID=36930 RepID=UPI002ED27F32